MSSKGGYAAAPPRQGVDRFYNPPAMRRQQQQQRHLLLQQQQMMRRQLLQQQKQEQRQPSRKASVRPESSAETEERIDVGDVPMAVSRPASAPASTPNVTNLDRLMKSVSPSIQARYLSEVNARGHPFFYLEDLWNSFNEWSVYGAGVPLLLNGKDPIEQYYVPFLSGIQLFIDPSKPSSCLSSGGSFEEGNSESSRLMKSSVGSTDFEGDRRAASILNSHMQRPNKPSYGEKSVLGPSSGETDVSMLPGFPVFQFLEHEQPYNRRPLTDKMSLLASNFPELSKYRSCDLLPSSWICVAWYPIYRIPIGPTLQDLDASFLTFHSLSTQPTSNWQMQFNAEMTSTVCDVGNPAAKISLPVFALASYKLKGSIVSPSGPQECDQENALLQAAEHWLGHLQVHLPDYQFFRSHSHQRR